MPSDSPSPSSESTAAVERQWIERINQGDKKAFEAMVRAYGARLVRFAVHITKSNEIAQELVQEVFCNIWEGRSHWQPGHTIRSYLYTATRNQSIGYLRHRRFETFWDDEVESIAEEEASLDEQIHVADFSKAVEEAVGSLPDRCRVIFRLHREEGLTYTEIGQILQISPKTVKAQVGRALKTLRIKLSHFLPLLAAFSLVYDPWIGR